MKIAFVGCGYVFDIYMRTRGSYPEIKICGVYDISPTRLSTVSRYYDLPTYASYEELLSDPEVEVVVNLTSIGSHYATVKKALEANKDVYTEKPITTSLEQTRELLDLAQARGRVLAAAPDNLFTDSIVTRWKAIQDGAIGKPILVYAELDDNPAHLMRLEIVRSPTGAPFPYAEELQEGCTVEHIAYHLVWICAIFGPALGVTAFSKALVENKTAEPLSPPDTPDLSVACLDFAGGVAARITCSWVAPRDHTMRIIGEKGQITIDNVFHDQSPVFLERFSRVSLSARKFASFRAQPLLGRRFGIGGQRLPLVRRWKSHAIEADRGVGRTLKNRLVSWVRRREAYAQDKILGIAEMGKAIREGRPQVMPPDFLLHLNELTLMIQAAGPVGIAAKPKTTFSPISSLTETAIKTRNYLTEYRPKLLERVMGGIVDALHR
jgi:predicted dehydrogenase